MFCEPVKIGGRLPVEALSACLIVKNEETNIRDCLESVAWADEIVVVDAYSSDKTVELCKAYTDKILLRAWTGFYDQVIFAIESAKNPWVLYIEADERVSPHLRKEIREQLAEPRAYSGYTVPRISSFLGHWVYHGSWYPDRLPRVFRKDKLMLEGPNPHLKWNIEGPVKDLQGPLFHHTARSLSHFLEKMDHYAEVTARTKYESGKPFRMWDLVVRPLARFFKSYVFKAGFLDGKTGFMVAWFGAMYVFTKYLKLWELEQSRRKAAPRRDV